MDRALEESSNPFTDLLPCLNATGIKINRVVRIHNRFLRNRFEESLEKLVDVRDSSYKKSLEYLFFGQNPHDAARIFRILEEGFSDPLLEVVEQSKIFLFFFDPFLFHVFRFSSIMVVTRDIEMFT